MRSLVLGGDGFCGWPTALHLSKQGHDVLIIDNLSRRKIDIELGVESLTPIVPIEERLETWNHNSNFKIDFKNVDIFADYFGLLHTINDFRPDNIVHFAEQRAAPYSMKNSRTKRYTVDNNITSTHNLLTAIVESGLDIHLVHLGTMGVYGYSSVGMKIPEGYLNVKLDVPSRGLVDQKIIYPTNPGSTYHMTKSLDQIMFAFYAKNNGIRITDLHQGIVWGTQTPETRLDEKLINRFDYDGDYGTVLNRFIMQAAINYPLTVHGTGGQTRAFIHISDTVKCISIACKNPPDNGEQVMIRNQVSETHRVRDLANMISQKTGVEIANIDNPRKEAEENDLEVENNSFLSLGLEPTYLEIGVIEEVYEIAKRYSGRVNLNHIPCVSKW
jgi:UDP-sulfoquinovose synthase